MAISVGDKIPDVAVNVLGSDGMPQAVQTGEVLGSGKVVLFGLPGAFTPGCSKLHLPGYVQGASDLAGKGVTKIACISMNDAWVMDAWAQAQGVGDSIVMLADGNGEFTKAIDLVLDGSGYGLGNRSRRYVAVIEDGTVTHLEVEAGGEVNVSACSNLLQQL